MKIIARMSAARSDCMDARRCSHCERRCQSFMEDQRATTRWDRMVDGARDPGTSRLRSFFGYPIAPMSLPANHAPPVRRAVFPGQFDPITNGHLDVIRRGLKLFDEIIVAVGTNPDKRGLFSLEEREDMIKQMLKDIPHTRVKKYSGLTADFVHEVQATAILRGIRDVSDLRYEFQLALANRAVGGIETVFIMTGDEYALTSSSLIRQVVALGGDVRTLASVLPPLVIDRLRDKQRQGKRFRAPLSDSPSI
jgi:pantetheine-phosphate adenylyltransferase